MPAARPAANNGNVPAARPAAAPVSASVGEALVKAEERRQRLSWLDKYRPGNGRSIGDYDPLEAASLQELRAREAKFVSLLVSQIPAGTYRTIRECITPDEADRYWELASAEFDARPAA